MAIKLKSKKLVSGYLIGKFLFAYFIFNGIFLFILFVDVVTDGFIVNAIDNISYSLAHFIVDIHPIIYMVLFLAYLGGNFLIGILPLIKAHEHISLMASSILKIPNISTKILPFPKELKNVENEMRDIQYTIYKNELNAKEAEQRKNDLVVYLAHDLKTPLTSIIGYLSLLDESPEMSCQARQKFTSISLDKAYRLEQLINEFFDITRFNLQNIELDKNHINISLMLSQIADEFYPLLEEKNLSIKTKIEPDINIIADADKLERVFDNIIRNAISYSYNNTCIHISASANHTLNEITVRLRNTGDEIPPEKLQRIFEKFFRLDSSRNTRKGGAGLGLAIAKQIVDMHGGNIYASSCSRYTEFVIELPFSPQRKNFVSNT